MLRSLVERARADAQVAGRQVGRRLGPELPETSADPLGSNRAMSAAGPLVLVVLAYLVGTLPTAQLVAARAGVDPTAAGSGNPGASNVTRLAGRRAGAVVLAGDLGKGAAATLVGLLAGGRALGLACGLAVVVGHIAPATRTTRRFRGGKGVATAAGVALVLWPVAAVVSAAVWLATVAVARRASVASIAMAGLLPVVVWLAVGQVVEVAGAALIAALIIVRHRDNVRRIRDGDEPAWR